VKEKIWQILQEHRGRNNPITSMTLGRMVGVDDREVRELIGQIIREGYFICAVSSDPMGYFVPENLGEVEAYEKTLQARALKLLARLKHISRERARKFLQEQMRIFTD